MVKLHNIWIQKEKSAEAGEKEGPKIITFHRHNWLLSNTKEKF